MVEIDFENLTEEGHERIRQLYADLWSGEYGWLPIRNFHDLADYDNWGVWRD